MWPVFNIFWATVATALLLFARHQIAKHHLRVGRVSLLQLALHDVQYCGASSSGSYRFTFTSTRLSLRFHWPCHPNPKLVTFVADNVLYKSTTADLSAGRMTTILWFFPILFRQTAGPWIDAELDDFRARIFGSDATPYFIKVFRSHLVSSALTGEIMRLDDSGANVSFHGVTEAAVQDEADPDGDGHAEHPGADRSNVPTDGAYDKQVGEHNAAAADSVAGADGTFAGVGNPSKTARPVPTLRREQDEVRITAFARGLMMHDKEGRMYTFAALDAQLRRNWTANRGNFVMIARDGRWVQVPCLHQMKPSPSFWKQLVLSVRHFPVDLYNTIRHPTRTANIYMRRADITFDNFRLRDAEVVMQALNLTCENLAESGIEWPDLFANVLADTLVEVLKD